MADLAFGGVFLEVMEVRIASLRVSTIVLEVMRSSTTSPLRVAQVVLEVMRDPIVIPEAPIGQASVIVISS